MPSTDPGFAPPNFTPVPNDFFDAHLADMDKAELKVVLAILRQTLGWVHPENRDLRRSQWRISIRDLAKVTGLSVDSIYKGAEAAEARGLIKRTQDGGVTKWEIVWQGPDETTEGEPHIGVMGVPEIGTPSEDPAFQPLEQAVPEIGTGVFQPLVQGVPVIGTPSIKESLKETDGEEKGKETTPGPSTEQPKTIPEQAAEAIDGWYGLTRTSGIHFWGDRGGPAHLQGILEAFSQVWCEMFDRQIIKGDVAKFIKQAGQLYEAYGEVVVEFMQEAGQMHKNRGSKIAINGPKSIEWAIREAIQKAAEKDPERYRSGKSRDFWDE